VVDDLGDDSELAGRWPVVDEDHSADLDESLEGGRLRRLLFGLSAQAKVIMRDSMDRHNREGYGAEV
jgi:hypothetical protein